MTEYVQSKPLIDKTCNVYHMLNAPKHDAYTIFPRRLLHQIQHYLIPFSEHLTRPLLLHFAHL